MGDFEIEFQDGEPNPADHDTLYGLLGEDALRRTGRPDQPGFAIFLRDGKSRAVIGGLCGKDDMGWCFIELLMVPDTLRGQGLGARLMAEAETIARRRGMVGVWLNTYDFQAPGFYERLGYTVFGELEGGQCAAGQLFLRKRFG